MPVTLADLDEIPRIGWIDEPTPITELPELQAQLGLAYLGVKRDDHISALHGGSKVRKLDYLLAHARYQQADEWASTGAIGSGQLVALSAAASELDHRLNAYVFWEPLSPGVVDNLAFIASHAATVHYYRGRISTALHHPKLLLGDEVGHAAVVPVGATTSLSMIGVVRAALELRAQIDAGMLPCPDEVVVACGSGGIAAGLSVGLGMAQLATKVRAVAVVERALTSYARMRHLQRGLIDELRAHGMDPASEPAALVIDRSALGRGYGHTTAGSESACARGADWGLQLEPIYSGKALAALIAAPGDAKKVLLWSTARGPTLPHDDNWQTRVPAALRARLDRRTQLRRRALLAASGIAAIALSWQRCGGYPQSNFEPRVLMNWEVSLLRSVAAVVLAPHATEDQLEQIPERVDRYLQHLPEQTRRELHAAFAVVEHGTTLFGVSWRRFTTAERSARDAQLEQLAKRSGLLAQCYRALRELCMLGHYQQTSSWAALGYDGPLVPEAAPPGDSKRVSWPEYDRLRATAGELPKGSVV